MFYLFEWSPINIEDAVSKCVYTLVVLRTADIKI
eukprot:COSAG02_NODE_817_length_16825_cov_49.127646_9_plen_34_part_00